MTKVACDAVVFCFLQPHAFQALARRQLGHPLQFARPSLRIPTKAATYSNLIPATIPT
jgi:hypothetical protein